MPDYPKFAEFKERKLQNPSVRAAYEEAKARRDAEPKHHLTLYKTGRFGSWATCACGWRSATFVGPEGAHLAFGEHLIRPASTTAPTQPTSAQVAGRAEGATS